MRHVHTWATLAESAIGAYRKRDCPGNEFLCPGRVEVCRCGAGRLVPAIPGFQVVEIEMGEKC